MGFEKNKLSNVFKKVAAGITSIGTIGLGMAGSFVGAMAAAQADFNNPVLAGVALATSILPMGVSYPLTAFLATKISGIKMDLTIRNLTPELIASFIGVGLMAAGYSIGKDNLDRKALLPMIDGQTEIVETISTPVRDIACGNKTSGVGIYTDPNGNEFQVACAPSNF